MSRLLAEARIWFRKEATMPVVKKASGHGATLSPIRYGPSSLANRQTFPVRLEATIVSFCMPPSDRPQVRSASPFLVAGGNNPSSRALATLKKSGLPKASNGLFEARLDFISCPSGHIPTGGRALGRADVPHPVPDFE